VAKLEFRKASRKSVPMLLSISGVSGSGKTYSALKLAAGLAGKTGKVGMIDTENGRGEIYADSPSIIEALPNGYEYARLDPPFTPKAYTDAIKAAEEAGITVCIIDSGSHEWEGIGGCTEIAEEKPIKGEPNWKLAKIPHKRFVNHLLCSPMHIIVCLRAREKVKYWKNPAKNGKVDIISAGIQPISEKNFPFEMLVSLRVDEETHHAKPLKVPEPLVHLFPEEALISKEMGERIREWNDGGNPLDEFDQIAKRAKAQALNGVEAYRHYFQSLTKIQKAWLIKHGHEDFKFDAEQADLAQAEQGQEAEDGV